MHARRFSPHWSVEELDACFVVIDSAGHPGCIGMPTRSPHTSSRVLTRYGGDEHCGLADYFNAVVIAHAGLAHAELSAIEREKLHLCPKNCAPYCEEIPAHPTYCTCFCQAPEPSDPAGCAINVSGAEYRRTF